MTVEDANVPNIKNNFSWQWLEKASICSFWMSDKIPGHLYAKSNTYAGGTSSSRQTGLEDSWRCVVI